MTLTTGRPGAAPPGDRPAGQQEHAGQQEPAGHPAGHPAGQPTGRQGDSTRPQPPEPQQDARRPATAPTGPTGGLTGLDAGLGISVAVAPTITVVATPLVPAPAPAQAAAPAPASAAAGRSAADARPTQRTRAAVGLARRAVARPLAGPGLTGLGGILLGVVVVGLGSGFSLLSGGTLGRTFGGAFLLASALVPVALRARALATAVVLPPLLFLAARVLESKVGGYPSGIRATGLDVATSLALSAPLLFTGSLLAVAIVIVRLLLPVLRR